MQDGLTIGELPVSDYSEARRLITSAFAQEPFAHVFGDSAVARFVGMANMYNKWPYAPNPVVIGATAGGHLVGVALATLPGECGLCDVATSSAVDCSNEGDRIEHEFQVACSQAHRVNELGPHARVEVVATEPTLHGSGVGRVLMGGVINALRQRRIECVVLECLTTRAAFYEHLGFHRVDEFDDPGGLRFVLMKSVVMSA